MLNEFKLVPLIAVMLLTAFTVSGFADDEQEISLQVIEALKSIRVKSITASNSDPIAKVCTKEVATQRKPIDCRLTLKMFNICLF